MAIQKDHTGKRWVEVSREVAGTQEEVWDAIATGPGISSWFVPTDVECDRSGKPVRVVSHFGDDPTMDSVAKITTWEPPHRFVGLSADLGPDAPEVETEWSVDTLSGSTSIVRVRHQLVSEADTWDVQMEDWEGGWPWFFNVLGLYLLHFRGQESAAFRVMGGAPQPTWDAWDDFSHAIGIANADVGDQVQSPDELPPLIGTVKYTSGEDQEFGTIARLDEPAAGIVSAFAMAMDGQVFLVLDFYFYGTQAVETAARWEGRWNAWMAERFGFEEE